MFAAQLFRNIIVFNACLFLKKKNKALSIGIVFETNNEESTNRARFGGTSGIHRRDYILYAIGVDWGLIVECDLYRGIRAM